MATLTLNNIPVTEARICMPLVGVWTADAVVDTDQKITGSVTMKTEGDLEFVGTVDPLRTGAGSTVNGSHVRVIGGAGGMGLIASPQFYRNPTVRMVINALLQKAGEVLSTTSSASVLDQTVAAWTTIASTIGNSVKGILETVAPMSTWRMLPSGQVFIGTDTYPESAKKEEIIDSSPSVAMDVIGTNAPRLLPGQAFNGKRISYIEHVVTSEKTRSFVYYGIG